MTTFPVDILPSHVHLSAVDQAFLFGGDVAMTVERKHSQPGQVVYKESLAVFGTGENFLRLRILGPPWRESSVELTPSEASFLGIEVVESKEGDLSTAAPVRLVGPAGEVFLEKACIVPKSSVLMSVDQARLLHVKNGDHVSVEIGQKTAVLEGVLVRVNPEFSLRLQIHQDLARDMWITGGASAHIIK
jgi:putative phosphotransacetylase